MTVLAISTARNNAELIRECADLGYLRSEWLTIDPTYGLGRFWALWRPDCLLASDLDPTKSPGEPADFTDLPYPNGYAQAVVFDPPYKLNGTGGSVTSDEAYGVANSVRWQDRMRLCRDGITEAARVLQVGGHLLVKCQDQVCSGAVRWQTIEFAAHAATVGCHLVDMLHLQAYRPQPEGRRQLHARRNYSTMLVLVKNLAVSLDTC